MQNRANADGGAAPTGCFKCGRPGHWSRDCPSSVPFPNSKPSSNTAQYSSKPPEPNATSAGAGAASKKIRRPRPKITPDLILSDDGLGYVLRHFPRSFKYHGHGREARDLGNLIGLYKQWHSQLIPYFSFDQFVEKVEQVGAVKRVRRCVQELRERVERGGDLTKLHEQHTKEATEDDLNPGTDNWGTPADINDLPPEGNEADDIQNELFDDIYRKATEEDTAQASPLLPAASEVNPEQPPEAPENHSANNTVNEPSRIQITEEQRARMEANRMRALERAAAARARTQQAS